MADAVTYRDMTTVRTTHVIQASSSACRHPNSSLEASKLETWCPLGNYTTGLIPLGDNENRDAIDLNRGYIDQHVPNPLVFTGYNWPVS